MCVFVPLSVCPIYNCNNNETNMKFVKKKYIHTYQCIHVYIRVCIRYMCMYMYVLALYGHVYSYVFVLKRIPDFSFNFLVGIYNISLKKKMNRNRNRINRWKNKYVVASVVVIKQKKKENK